MTESQLIQLCLKRDRKAQKELYDKYGPRLMALCLRYVSNREDAEDIFHDSMLKVFEKLHTWQGHSALQTWICRIGINTALDFIRQHKRVMMVDVADQFLQTEDELPLETQSIDPEVAIVILNQLPLQHKLIVNLHLVDKMSHAEIATALQITEMASRTRLRRARQVLTQMYHDYMKQTHETVARHI